MLCISDAYKTKNQGNYFFCFSFLDCITLIYWVQLLFLYNYFEYFQQFCTIYCIFCIIFLLSLSYILLYLQPDILYHYQIKIEKSVKLICNKCIPKLSIKCNNNHCSMYTRLCIPAISTPLLMLQLCKMYLINLYYRKYICI